jgi:hypothetical protein
MTFEVGFTIYLNIIIILSNTLKYNKAYKNSHYKNIPIKQTEARIEKAVIQMIALFFYENKLEYYVRIDYKDFVVKARGVEEELF